MKKIEQFQIRKIYAIGNALGIVESGNGEDELHVLVGGATGKESIRELTYREAAEVISRLEALQGRPAPSKGKGHSRPGGVTPGQQKKIWALMYSLKACDRKPSEVGLGDRLCAVIRKELKMDAAAKDPFAWLSCEQGNQLIEMLKRYVESAKRKVEA
jgi:hypothetical protein